MEIMLDFGNITISVSLLPRSQGPSFASMARPRPSRSEAALGSSRGLCFDFPQGEGLLGVHAA